MRGIPAFAMIVDEAPRRLTQYGVLERFVPYVNVKGLARS
jgi:hypothetical protein